MCIIYTIMKEQATKDEGKQQELPITLVTSSLRDVLGERIAALIVLNDFYGKNQGVDLSLLENVANGKLKLSPEVEAGVRNAQQVIDLLKTTEDLETIKAWFIGSDPILDGESPALEICKNPERVYKAAEVFLVE